MRRILLDTSVLIDFLRRKDKDKSLLYGLASEALSIAVITHTELYAGKSVWEKAEAREDLEKLFSGLMILPLEQDISEQAGRLKASYPNMSLIDCIIAATALFHNLELATLNVKDFKQISRLQTVSS